MTDSRQFVPELITELERQDDGRMILLAPSPGLWRERPEPRSLVRSGDAIGWLEILGVAHRLRAPAGAMGIVIDEGPHRELARAGVDYRAPLLTLDPEGLGSALATESTSAAAATTVGGSLVFEAATSGRFYARPAPDKPTFVEVGQVIERGQTIGLLEVMKTFTRINYDNPKLPARARILAIVAADQADLDRGDVILKLEAAD